MRNKKSIEGYKKILFIALPIFLVMLACDLVTKYITNLKLGENESVSFIPGFINFINVHNDGAAWNIFSGNQVFLIIFTFTFLIAFGFLYFKERGNNILFHIASSLIFTGCIGNLIDRLLFGYVRDMIHFEFWPKFPVFNIADICVCIGVILLIIFYIVLLVKSERKEKDNVSDNK